MTHSEPVNIPNRSFAKINGLCLCLSLVGFIINFIAYYPGFLSPDSLDQYSQALHHHYGNWHPPIMSAFWHLLLSIYNGPQAMLFFQLLLLWSSFYIILLLFLKNYRKMVWLVLLFFCAPFVQNFAGNIWKDVHMALSWLLATAILLNAFFDRRQLNRYESAISLLLLSYGCWVRLNALPGLLPLLILWLVLQKKTQLQDRFFKWSLIFKACAMAVLIILSQALITKILIKPDPQFSEYKLFAHDITGIYVKTHENYFPDFVKQHEGFDTLYLKQHYKPATFDNIWWNNDGKNILPGVDASTIKVMRSCWLKAIWEHPIVYLKNRMSGYLSFLRITDQNDNFIPVYPYIHPNDLGFSLEPNFLNKSIIPSLKNQGDCFYMQPWFWLLLNILLFGVILIKRLTFIKPIVLMLLLSSFLYLALEFFVFQVNTDFRYFYWNCISVSLALILIISEFIKLSSQKQQTI